MTKEEKAKRYDEAIERAKKMFSEKEVNFLFPELNGSEDERIRKDILDFIRREGQHIDKLEWHKWIAWLKKQGKEEYALKSFKDEDVRKFMQCIEKQAKAYEFNLPNRGYDIYAFAKDLLVWLEKQGEQKHIDNLTPQEAMDIAVAKCFEQGEQKPADKVEPKFHKGDWVVYNNDICQIVKREEGCNKLVTVFGIEKELVNERNLSTARFWTIQDAKDGDVLDANGAPFIYKKHDKDYVYFYCGVNLAGEFIEANGIDTWNNNYKVYPATKEQREQLEKAMADAGYIFDFERKDLKKIENEIEIPFGAKDSELQEVTYYIPKGFHAEINDDKVVIKKVEKSIVWSEEDETELTNTIIMLKEGASLHFNTNDITKAVD